VGFICGLQQGYYADAKKYAQDTELGRRVAEWEENIQPRLNEEVFDMSQCIGRNTCRS